MSKAATRATSRKTSLAGLAGPLGPDICTSMLKAKKFLEEHGDNELLKLIGRSVRGIPHAKGIDKAVIQKSFGGGNVAETDDLLAGKGLFYITERGKLFLDCTAGHYQMTWGYNHPVLTKLVLEGIHSGVVTDNHSNIPQWPVKRLAQKLVELANQDRPELCRGDFSKIIKSTTRLNTVLLGVATGSVACEAALKMMLMRHEQLKKPRPVVFVVLNGNYHGTGMFSQNLRGMWTPYIRNVKVVTVEPNDSAQIEKAFRQYGERIAGFWAEPIMMNREAILLEPQYLRLARQLTEQTGSLMALDEIQTGFWTPELFMFKQYGITPDIVIFGKGMTAGFHPLSGVLYRRELDMLAQYDAISTNGNASLASLVALANIDLIQRQADRIRSVQAYYYRKLQELAGAFPDRIAAVNGRWSMTGLKFRRVDDALAFHKSCVSSGLWLRVHAYHVGHSTILCKFALCLEPHVVDVFISRLQKLLEST